MNQPCAPLWLWILEDDPEVRSVMVMLCQHEGFNILEMDTIEKATLALKAANRFGISPDGVVSDFHLSDGNSEVFLRDCKSIFPDLPILCLSGGIDDGASARLHQFGVEIGNKSAGLKEFMMFLWKVAQISSSKTAER